MEQFTEKRPSSRSSAPLEAAASLPSPELSPEGVADVREQCRQLADHIDAELSPRDRTIVRSILADERLPSEVATALGVNRQVIDNVMHRARGLARAFEAKLKRR